jgi:hypothetical protein
MLDDADIAGPLVYSALLGAVLLLSGKVCPSDTPINLTCLSRYILATSMDSVYSGALRSILSLTYWIDLKASICGGQHLYWVIAYFPSLD